MRLVKVCHCVLLKVCFIESPKACRMIVGFQACYRQATTPITPGVGDGYSSFATKYVIRDETAIFTTVCSRSASIYNQRKSYYALLS
jgi:hypothetical protein